MAGDPSRPPTGADVTTTDEPSPAPATSTRTPTFAEHFADIRANVERVIRGKADVVHHLVLALVCDGHVLVEDVPGVGKTSLAKALARSVDGTFGRIQFTPDLLPTDVTGVSVWNRATGTFEFRPGPVFADVLLADEINRASPKTQSALLEAMAEHQVTVDGITRHLGSPFMVIATQNPIEHEGTYPLPESQLDRFLMRLSIGYPDRHAEIEILETHGDHEPVDDIGPVTTAAQVRRMNATLPHVHVSEALRAYLLDLADATRRHPALALGLSPRGVLALQKAARAQAAASGRGFVTPDDVKALARVVLPHRLLPTPDSRMRGMGTVEIVDDILAGVPVPRG
ncbi:MAG: MoxR family ATPase [Actinomyces sp.]|nr:MAG: MoxR family ATPase [Actinomyces sp.]